MIINCRMIAFIGAAEQRNELALYAPLLGRLLPELPLHRAAEDAIVGHVFGAMERHHVDFSGTALSFVERGVFTSMSLLIFADERASRCRDCQKAVNGHSSTRSAETQKHHD
jgi:hypothetical protein